MPKPYVEWIDENREVQRLEIVDRVFIGRSCKGVDPQKRILVYHAQVSRDHAVISRSSADHLQITDMSKNGTWVNGIRLAAGSSVELMDGDTISLGGFSLRVFYAEDDTTLKDRAIFTQGTMVTPSEILVTNVVADVREFSGFSEAHGSSDVYTVMKEIFDTFSAIVHSFRGTHDVRPVSSQAVLACQAAIQQTQTMKEIRARLSTRRIDADHLQMGWGITTGKVTLSHYGSRAADLALVGDCTNLAFRLSSIANKELPEKIIICSQTAELVRNDLSVKDLGTVTIKGRKGKEHVFALI